MNSADRIEDAGSARPAGVIQHALIAASHSDVKEATTIVLCSLAAAQMAVVSRDLLIEAADEITAYVKREYAGSEGYPSMERRMQRDMDVAHRLRRAADSIGAL